MFVWLESCDNGVEVLEITVNETQELGHAASGVSIR